MRNAAAAGVCAFVMACAPGSYRAAAHASPIGVQRESFFTAPRLRLSSTPLTPLRLRVSMLQRDGSSTAGDRSVGAAGLLGSTTNEVVPIPGTDMIRVGFLQEGTFSSNQFRSGAQEALTLGGLAGAVLIFTIARP